MNFFKLYIGDYQRDTAHLSVTEHGAFLLMLQHYYATEKPLPTGKALHRMLRAQDKAEREAIDAVAAQFWTETPGGLINERADAEITKASAQADTNRTIAQAREAKRKAAREQHDKSTNRATNDQPNQTPDTRHQTKDKSNRHTESIRPLRDDCTPLDWEAWRGFFEAEHGIACDPYSHHDRAKLKPIATAWANSKVTVGQMRKAIAQAQSQAKEPIAYLPSYVDRVLASMRNEADSGPSAGAMLLGLHQAPHADEPDYIDMEG